MNANEARNRLMEYSGKKKVLDVYKKHVEAHNDGNALWDQYIEYFVVKTLGNDAASGNLCRKYLFIIIVL